MDTMNADSQAVIRELARQRSKQHFRVAERDRVIYLVRKGYTIAEAAADAGVSTQQVYGRARWDIPFRDALDGAMGADFSAQNWHGTDKGLELRCACSRCRDHRRAARAGAASVPGPEN